MIDPGSRWKHWKGRTYVVVCVATHTETGEELVICRRETDLPGVPARARPLAMWQDRETETGEPRFKELLR